MRIYEAKAYARITLGLDVISRTDDGYHQMDIIKQKISLCDSISMTVSDEMKVICDNLLVPEGPENTALRAAQLMKNLYHINDNLTIHIKKHIPVMAGLAGGSSDAACVIGLFDDIWALGLSLDEKVDIGRRVGMDVPFFFFQGICSDRETSEAPDTISHASGLSLVIIYPGFGISTKEAFQTFDKTMLFGKSTQIHRLKGILQKDYRAETIGPALYNRFEKVLFPCYPQLSSIKQRLCHMGCEGALLSGSGSAVFGIAKGPDSALDMAEKMGGKGYQTYVGVTI